MVQQLASVPASHYLTPEEMRRLIAAAQDVPVSLATDEDGAVRVIHGKTAESEAALERLTTAFIASLRKAAATSKVLDADDAFGLVNAEFIAAVRRYDLTSDVPFSATIGTILRFAVSDADRTSDLIVVKENVAARYWRLMHKHGFEVEAAYAECRDTPNGFDPSTFLAVHHAIGGLDSIDPMLSTDEYAPALALVSAVAGPEERVVMADTVECLFAIVGDKEEQILRLRYGFRDHATESLLVEHGLHLGDVLTDVQVAEVTGIARSTVNRLANGALAAMRAYLQELVAEEAA